MKRLLALFLCAVMCIALISCSENAEKDGGEEDALEQIYVPGDIALKSENCSFTRAELSYVFYLNYTDFKYANTDNVDFYNIDTERSLKDQIYYDDLTWFDHFSDMSLEYMEELLRYCEEAKALGIELDETELDEVEKAVQSYISFAEDYGYTAEEYLALQFNSDVSIDVLRSYMEKEALAFKLYRQVVDSFEFSDDEISEEVENNPKLYRYVDYIAYTFDEKNDDNAKSAADELAAITDPAAFDAYIVDYMVNTLDKKKDSAEEYHTENAYFEEYNDFLEWAYDGAKDLTTYKDYDDVAGTYTVYLLTKAPYLHEKNTKDIRVISVDIDKYDSVFQAEEGAKEILDEWKAGEATEESFATLANQKSDDVGTNLIGGLVEGVYENDPTSPEGLDEWLYSDERKPGDTCVFSDVEYSYVVYFVADGDTKWKQQGKLGLTQAAYDEYVEDLKEKYETERIEEVINSIDA